MLRSFFYAGWVAFLTCFGSPKPTVKTGPRKGLYILRNGATIYGLPENASADYVLLPKTVGCPRNCLRARIEIMWQGSKPNQLSAALEEVYARLFDALKSPRKDVSYKASFSITVGDTEFLGVQFGTATVLAIHDAVVVNIPLYATSITRAGLESEVLHGAATS